MARALARALFFCLAGCALPVLVWGQQLPAGSGFVEGAQMAPDSRQLLVSGWAAPDKPNVFISNLVLLLDGQEIYRGRLERFERPDVARATQRPEWLLSGFRARVAVPDHVATGPRRLAARMRLGDGNEFDLQVVPGLEQVEIAPQTKPPSLLARAALALALALPLLVLLRSLRRAAGSESDQTHAMARSARYFGIAVTASFVLLVGGGWTGSSLGLAVQAPAAVDAIDAPWIGNLRVVRSDEWQVITPLALSQATHQPPFARINRNLGGDGHNMLVVGMAGVPVAHVSALAKPATWGFFAFDLRRALAWYWWFPFFACFGALWLLLLRFFALDWRMAAVLSASFSASPYSVVFSGWPAYAAFFPLAAVLAADAALRATRWQRAIPAGLLCGLAMAGFVLLLYPAWQISLAYLLAPFSLAWFIRERAALRFKAPQGVALVAAVALLAAVLWPWWRDTHDAVAAIRATVYPGQRSLETGGDIEPWFLIKGLMSPVTMYRDTSLMFGASDAGSVWLLMLAAFSATLWRCWSTRRLDPVAAVVCLYLAGALAFMFAGVPAGVARWTLWGSATSYRLDLALALAQVLLFAWLASPDRRTGSAVTPVPGAPRWLAVAVAAAAVVQAWLLFGRVAPPISEVFLPSYLLLGAAALASASFLLVNGRHASAFALYALVMLSAVLPFNPLSQTTDAVRASPALVQAWSALGSGRDGRAGIAVVDDRNSAMTFPAAGLPVVNSVFYYPQTALWRRLDPQATQQVVYNRYQRVLLVLGANDMEEAYRIDSPRLDEVRVTLHPTRFDFRLLGAQAAWMPRLSAAAVAGNRGLRVAHAEREWTLFEVLP